MANRINRPDRITSITPHYSALEERVYALAGDIAGVKQDVHELRSSMASREDVVSLTTKFDAFVSSQKTQWGPIWQAASVAVAFVTLIGWLAYQPLSIGLGDIRDIVRADISSQHERFIPRPEIDVRWKWDDERHERLTQRIDVLEKDVAGSYTIKDAIEGLRDRLNVLQGVLTNEIRVPRL